MTLFQRARRLFRFLKLPTYTDEHVAVVKNVKRPGSEIRLLRHIIIESVVDFPYILLDHDTLKKFGLPTFKIIEIEREKRWMT